MGAQALAMLGFIVSIVLTVYAIIFLGGRNMKDIQKFMIGNIGKATGLGALLLLVLPIVSMIFIISGFGLFLGISGIIIWLILIPFSILFAAISFGEIISDKLAKNISGKIYYTALIGIIVSFIIFKIPFLGFLIIVFFMWWGSGGFLMKLIEGRKDDIVIRKKAIKKEEDIMTIEKELDEGTEGNKEEDIK
jgi:hypothetical protein